ncbi:TPA: restriction endonuclease [Escherichia coli]|nr:restriction endonuclease [Escherichia coli]RRB14615.1 restriction endonuclease [Escherichia coli]HAJ6070273.1 restriction endonuclease [Escherichia coli]HAL1695860.1 restriction endonuclease [Escherichia coli]
MIWQPEFTDKTLSRKPGAVHLLSFGSRGFDVLRGPAFCSLRYSPSPF